MKKVLTAAAMREVDRLTTERYALPGLLLMENAGSAVVTALLETFGAPAELRVAILCGRGNNGGDGAVVARQLWQRGASVELFLLGERKATKGDAQVNFEIAARLADTDGLDAGEITFTELLAETDWRRVYDSLDEYDLVVDALLGTGLNRPAEGLYATVIGDLSRFCPAPLVAVDLPSGLSADTGQLFEPHLTADLTITFTAPKIGNTLAPACFQGGRLITAPIGSPAELIEATGSRLNLLEASDIAEYLIDSRRRPDSHKGAVGDVLVIAGSRGKTGAACLAAEAVLRAGAGLVTIATPRSAQPVIAQRVTTEVMTEPLAETEQGAVAQEALDRAAELLARREVLAIGPGLESAEESTRAFVRGLLIRRTVPAVVDADGLNCLSPWAENLKGSAALPLILTPHPGEMARLLGCQISAVQAQPVELAREFAQAHSLILLLKGARTIIAAPDGEVYVNPTGNSGMSTAGAGDVLTGIIAGLLAQRPQAPLQAVWAGAFLHGLAGDLAAQELGVRSLLASDLTRYLSAALLQVGGPAEKPETY